jgi:hypothetical protein
MSIIAKCDYCVLEGATYRRQTEIYDGILPDVMMCSNCGYAALFERERIIKLLETKQGFCYESANRNRKCDHEQCKWFPYIIALIKGEQE